MQAVKDKLPDVEEEKEEAKEEEVKVGVEVEKPVSPTPMNPVQDDIDGSNELGAMPVQSEERQGNRIGHDNQSFVWSKMNECNPGRFGRDI